MKDSFVLYTRYGKHIKKLSMEQRGVLFTAILSYMEGEEVFGLEPATDMIFGIIKEDIDENNRKWEETKASRAEAGRAGGKARASKAKQKQANEANATFAKQEQANQAVNVNVNDNVSKEKEIKKKKAKTHCVDETEFEALWAVYPRKNGKAQAKKAYEKAVKDGATFDEVMAGILAYKEYIDKAGTEAQYIKMGSTFFNQRAWADEWTIPEARAKPKSNVYTPEPPKYKVLEPDPVIDKTPMPKEIRDKLKGMFD